MASFTKHGNTWQYTISRLIDGKQKPIRKGGFQTIEDAKNAALQVELDLVNGVLNPAKEYPIEKYFKSWYETYKTDISNITPNSYKATHGKLKDYFKDRAIQNITKREYQEFLNDMGKNLRRPQIAK